MDAGQYYAHPRNAFWPIIERVIGIGRDQSYALRCEQLSASGIAVWDVLASCRRPGSLDSAIDPASVVVNDFAGFFVAHPRIDRIGFNGAAAENLFRRQALPALPRAVAALSMTRLPSTSPAHASMTLAQKTERWRAFLEDA